MSRYFNPAERMIYFAVALAVTVGAWFGYSDPAFFNATYACEDGVIEWLTAVSLFCGAIISLQRLIRLRTRRSNYFLTVLALTALVFIFGAGEEISWGQRVFNLDTPQTLKEINSQGEINLHNIKIGDFKVNKLIFSQLLGLGLLVYLLVLPVLYSRFSSWQSWANQSAVPIPRWPQIIFFIACFLAASAISSERKWELVEFCGGMCFVTMLAFPRNQGIFTVSLE